MLEAHVIQTKGFKNVGEGDASGFQVTVRCPYYRGIWASLIEGAELTVDGETFGSDSVSWTLGRASYSTAELAESDDVRWAFEEPAILTVDKPGGLEPGLHDVQRRRHLALVVHPGRDAADDEHLVAEAGARPMTPAASDITFGVSLYSYGGDFLVTMSLEDCLADVADMGATDLEILADTHIPGYPTPSTEWVDHWHALLERHALVPTCYSSWLDTRLHRDRDPHRGRGGGDPDARPRARAPARVHDRSGRSSASSRSISSRIRSGARPSRRVLPTAEEFDIRIAPEIHAPTPLRSTIVEDYVDLVRETGTRHFGLLIDTGIFQTGERTGSAQRLGLRLRRARSPSSGSGSPARCRSRWRSTRPTSSI